MAWFWVALCVILQLALIWEMNRNSRVNALKEYGYEAGMIQITERIRFVLGNNLTLGSDSRHRDDDDSIQHLCSRQPNLSFYLMTQAVWASRMMGQWSACRTLLSQIFACPVKVVRSATVLEDDGKMFVTGLMPMDRYIMAFLLPLPRLIVAVILWVSGASNLALTPDFSDLLFKVVQLNLITRVERMLLQFFVSHSKREFVRNAKLVQEWWGPVWHPLTSWPGELLKLASTLALVFFGLCFGFTRAQGGLFKACSECMFSCSKPCSRSFYECQGHIGASWTRVISPATKYRDIYEIINGVK